MQPPLPSTPPIPVLVEGRDDVERYARPARGDRGGTTIVARPADVGEVRTLVRWAVAERVQLLPQGANSGLVGASVPPSRPPTSPGQAPESGRPLVVVSTERLGGIELSAAEGTAVVGAGVRLSQLNDAGAAAGVHLPIDLGSDPAIGGMVSTNTGGSRVLRYGPMRRYVLGVEAVAADADATVFGGLRTLRKDSRGVDAAQLLVGAGGTLGIVTRVALALAPLPESSRTWWLALDDPARGGDLLELCRAGGELLSAFEFVAGTVLERILRGPGAPANPFGDSIPSAVVLAEWSGREAELDAAAETAITGAFDTGLLSDARSVPPTAGWGLRHAINERLRTHGAILGHDVSCRPADLMVMRAACIEVVARIAPDAVVCDFGHAGDGGLHVQVLFEGDAPSAALAADVRRAVYDVVAGFGGSYSAEHGLGPVNAGRWLQETGAIEQAAVRACKGAVDPHGVLGHPGHPYNRL